MFNRSQQCFISFGIPCAWFSWFRTAGGGFVLYFNTFINMSCNDSVLAVTLLKTRHTRTHIRFQTLMWIVLQSRLHSKRLRPRFEAQSKETQWFRQFNNKRNPGVFLAAPPSLIKWTDEKSKLHFKCLIHSLMANDTGLCRRCLFKLKLELFVSTLFYLLAQSCVLTNR